MIEICMMICLTITFVVSFICITVYKTNETISDLREDCTRYKEKYNEYVGNVRDLLYNKTETKHKLEALMKLYQDR